VPAGDRQLADRQDPDANYTYNDNEVLVNAIKQGYKGAYWDILRRLKLDAKAGS
jgi:hypothetical protein